MTTLYHNGKAIQEVREDWQTRPHGTLQDRYECYLEYADNGQGRDITTGEPLKTFEEWLGS